MTVPLIYLDIVKGWGPINDITSIIKLLFGIPILIDIKNITAYCFNFTVIISLENKRSK